MTNNSAKLKIVYYTLNNVKNSKNINNLLQKRYKRNINIYSTLFHVVIMYKKNARILLF